MTHIRYNKTLWATVLSLAFFTATPASAQHISLDRKVCEERGLWGKTPQASAAAKNIFKQAKASASGHYNSDIAANAVDGLVDGGKYWGCENLPVWHQVELDKVESIESIKIWLYWQDARIYQYKIQGSLDGKRWKTLVDQRSNSIAFTSDGQTFNFKASKVRFVRTTITKSNMGAASGGHIVEIQAFKKQAQGGMRATAFSDLERLPWTGAVNATPTENNAIRLTGWKGERVNAQILVQSAQSLKQLRITSTNMKSRAGKAFPIKANFIKFTQSHGTPIADIISNKSNEQLNDASGINRGVWVSLDIPRNASVGTYQGKIKISAKGEKSIIIPVAIKVQPQTLPAAKDWGILLDIWQHPDSVARWHDVEPWSDEHFAIMKPMMKRLADSGQKVITAALIDEAWGGQTYDKFGAMIEWIKEKDGRLSWDYTNFDKWIDFMINEVGIKDQISCYTMIPWSMKVRVFNKATGEYEFMENNPVAPSFEKLWGPFLSDFSKHVRSKGWEDITTIAIDERPDHLVRATLKIIKKYAPKFEVASAVNAPSSTSGLVYSMSPIITHTASISPEMMKQRRADGKKTTFYVCVHPRRPNNFTFSPLSEGVWLGLFAAVHNYDGFLRWAYMSWGRNPFESTDFAPFPSGDCYLVYPGNRSSLRWEKLRDGIEEFEKYNILLKKATRNPALRSKMKAFKKALLPRFDQRKTGQADYRADVNFFTQQINKISNESK